MSDIILHSITDSNILPGYRTDHSIIYITLKFNEFQRGRGLWKSNNDLLKDQAYIETVKKCILRVKKQYCVPVYDVENVDNINNDSIEFTINDQLFLETLLLEIRGKTISYSSFRKKEKDRQENQLVKEIEDMENSENVNLISIENKKKTLENLRKVKIQGIITRSRVRWIEEGEKPTQYVLSLEKRNFISKTIPMLCTQNNTLITDQKEILNEVKDFYCNLYKDRDTLDVNLNNVVNNVNIPRLNDNQANELEGKITKPEIINALKRMKNNKSPGSDGYTVEFFKFLKGLLDFVLRSINYGFSNHELSSTQRQGIITCLPKGEKSKLYLKNWRPITLLNVVYKLGSSCIAERLKKVLDILISQDQTGFIKGRFIGENTRLVYDVMQQSDLRNIPGLLLLLDFEKAYDSVSWKFMNKVLDFFGFGPQLKAWINLFNKGINAAVTQCGFLSIFSYKSRL